jgi:hypothetical protein
MSNPKDDLLYSSALCKHKENRTCGAQLIAKVTTATRTTTRIKKENDGNRTGRN